MHLLMTCLVTNRRRDGSESPNDRMGYLLRTLSSLARTPIASASFFIEFGSDVEFDGRDLHDACRKITKNYTLEMKRLESFSEWRDETQRVLATKPSTVLLLTYEDHEYVQEDSHELELLEKSIIKEAHLRPDLKPIAVLSHFPEIHIQCDYWQALGFHDKAGPFALIPLNTPIGCLVAPPEILAGWFEIDFTQGKKIVSTENYFGPSVLDGKIISLVPRQELFRHIDGYGHVGLQQNFAIESQSGLISRSRTYTAMQRTGEIDQPCEYLAILSKLPFSTRICLLLRSLFLFVPSKMTRSSFILKLHYALMTTHPYAYQQISTGFSHGLARYFFHLLGQILNLLRK